MAAALSYLQWCPSWTEASALVKSGEWWANWVVERGDLSATACVGSQALAALVSMGSHSFAFLFSFAAVVLSGLSLALDKAVRAGQTGGNAAVSREVPGNKEMVAPLKWGRSRRELQASAENHAVSFRRMGCKTRRLNSVRGYRCCTACGTWRWRVTSMFLLWLGSVWKLWGISLWYEPATSWCE